MEAQKNYDEQLWKKAEERVKFKRHFSSYVLVNLFLWLLWLFTDGRNNVGIPWPLWPMLGWGIGIASHYYKAYMTDYDAVQKEYEKLRGRQDS